MVRTNLTLQDFNENHNKWPGSYKPARRYQERVIAQNLLRNCSWQFRLLLLLSGCGSYWQVHIYTCHQTINLVKSIFYIHHLRDISVTSANLFFSFLFLFLLILYHWKHSPHSVRREGLWAHSAAQMRLVSDAKVHRLPIKKLNFHSKRILMSSEREGKNNTKTCQSQGDDPGIELVWDPDAGVRGDGFLISNGQKTCRFYIND